MIKRRSGITLWEIILFTVFLAIAGGASVFFFFLNSDDVKKAQQKFDWVQKINLALDAISLEIANSTQLEHPFAGNSRECFFRAPVDSGALLPGEIQEGFAFSDNSLVYLSRNADTVSDLRRLGQFNNPLITGCRDGKFTRIAADRLEIRLRVQSPDDNMQTREFSRLIYLRNQ